MLEDLRKQADESAYEFEDYEEEEPEEPTGWSARFYRGGKFLGMTPTQRFVLALMLLLLTCLFGFFFLLVTGRIAPSFLF